MRKWVGGLKGKREEKKKLIRTNLEMNSSLSRLQVPI